ncbi:uncharacterized protein LOC134722874 [Mytilus trossulus]|uniref:uncharacterized protein LOC134722874 n=1 Tax=Mytilus trossulus TaxID=6551 RepID=UPI0030064655
MYGHVAEAKMTNQDYKKYMLETEKSLILIAAMCQKETEARQTIDDLRERPLDETLLIKYQTVLLRDIQAEKEISETQREIKEYLETNFGSVQERLASLELLHTTKMQDVLSAMDEIGNQKTKDTGRRTEKYDEISRLTDAAVKAHLEEGTFVQTIAMPAILKCLKEKGHVVITGPSGSGKSRIALETLHQYSKEGSPYTMINLPNISEWQEVIDINDNCIVLCDDFFGKTKSIFNEDIHIKNVDAIYTCVKSEHVKVILTMRDNIKHKCATLISKHRLFCSDTLIDLKYKDFRMNKVEKRKCLLNYLHKHGVREITDQDEENYSTASCNLKDTIYFHSNTTDCIVENESNSIIDFPQTCYMFTSNRKFLKQGISFFKHANEILCEHITDMKEKGNTDANFLVDFTVLSFILLSSDKINVEHLNLQQINNVSSSIFRHRDNSFTKHDVVESVNRLQIGNYLRKESNFYCFQHRTIFEAVFLSCHSINTANLVQMMDFDFIVEMTRPEDYNDLDGEMIYKVSEHNYTLLAQRLIFFLDYKYTEPKKISNEKKACLLWNVIKSQNIRIEDLHSPDGFIQNGFVEVFRNISSLELLCRVINDSRTLLLNVDEFLGFLFDKDFKFKNLNLLLNKFDRKLFNKLLWMNAACEIGEIELVKCFCEYFTFRSFDIMDMVYTIKKACTNCNTELVHLFVTHIAANDELIDHVWEVISSHGSADFIKAYFKMYGFGHFNMTVVMSWASRSRNIDFINCVLETVDHGLHDMKLIMTLACVNGYFELVSFLLESVNHNLFDLDPVLDFACERNNKDFLLFIMTTCAKTLIYIDSVFVWVCSKADVRFLKVLLETVNHDLFCKDTSGINSVLGWACSNGDLDVIKFLFEKVGQEYFDISAAIKIAMDSKCKDIVLFLLEKSHQQNIDMNAMVALIRSNEDFNNVISLFKRKTVLSLTTDNLNKLTKIVLENNCEELINLIVNNAKAVLSYENINSILQWSCKKGDISITKLTIEKFVFEPCNIISGMKEVCYSQTGNLDIMKILVKTCAYYPLDFKMPMTKACSLGRFALVRYLLDTFDNNVFDMKSVLNWACAKGNRDHVNHVLDNFDNELFDFECALNNACTTGNEDIVILLIEKKHPSVFNMNSAVENASTNGFLQIVQLIFERCDRSFFNMSFLFKRACRNGELQFVEILLTKDYCRLRKYVKRTIRKSENDDIISLLRNFSIKKPI